MRKRDIAKKTKMSEAHRRKYDEKLQNILSEMGADGDGYKSPVVCMWLLFEAIWACKNASGGDKEEVLKAVNMIVGAIEW